MKRLGISLYPQHSTFEEMKRYVQLAHDNGFDRIFTCLMSLKQDEERQSYSKSMNLPNASALTYPLILHQVFLKI